MHKINEGGFFSKGNIAAAKAGDIDKIKNTRDDSGSASEKPTGSASADLDVAQDAASGKSQEDADRGVFIGKLRRSGALKDFIDDQYKFMQNYFRKFTGPVKSIPELKSTPNSYYVDDDFNISVNVANNSTIEFNMNSFPALCANKTVNFDKCYGNAEILVDFEKLPANFFKTIEGDLIINCNGLMPNVPISLNSIENFPEKITGELQFMGYMTSLSDESIQKLSDMYGGASLDIESCFSDVDLDSDALINYIKEYFSGILYRGNDANMKTYTHFRIDTRNGVTLIIYCADFYASVDAKFLTTIKSMGVDKINIRFCQGFYIGGLDTVSAEEIPAVVCDGNAYILNDIEDAEVAKMVVSKNGTVYQNGGGENVQRIESIRGVVRAFKTIFNTFSYSEDLKPGTFKVNEDGTVDVNVDDKKMRRLLITASKMDAIAGSEIMINRVIGDVVLVATTRDSIPENCPREVDGNLTISYSSKLKDINNLPSMVTGTIQCGATETGNAVSQITNELNSYVDNMSSASNDTNESLDEEINSRIEAGRNFINEAFDKSDTLRFLMELRDKDGKHVNRNIFTKAAEMFSIEWDKVTDEVVGAPVTDWGKIKQIMYQSKVTHSKGRYNAMGLMIFTDKNDKINIIMNGSGDACYEKDIMDPIINANKKTVKAFKETIINEYSLDNNNFSTSKGKTLRDFYNRLGYYFLAWCARGGELPKVTKPSEKWVYGGAAYDALNMGSVFGSTGTSGAYNGDLLKNLAVDIINKYDIGQNHWNRKEHQNETTKVSLSPFQNLTQKGTLNAALEIERNCRDFDKSFGFELIGSEFSKLILTSVSDLDEDPNAYDFSKSEDRKAFYEAHKNDDIDNSLLFSATGKGAKRFRIDTIQFLPKECAKMYYLQSRLSNDDFNFGNPSDDPEKRMKSFSTDSQSKYLMSLRRKRDHMYGKNPHFASQQKGVEIPQKPVPDENGNISADDAEKYEKNLDAAKKPMIDNVEKRKTLNQLMSGVMYNRERIHDISIDDTLTGTLNMKASEILSIIDDMSRSVRVFNTINNNYYKHRSSYDYESDYENITSFLKNLSDNMNTFIECIDDDDFDTAYDKAEEITDGFIQLSSSTTFEIGNFVKPTTSPNRERVAKTPVPLDKSYPRRSK